MAFSAEDFARTCLVRILPRNRFRLAGQTDSRFQSFAGNTVRIAYRQQGATPAFLLFAGPGQDPRAAATAAAAWAETSWRPNAIQRSVRPGVVVIHVAPGSQLATAGPVDGAAVKSAIWTVDSETGQVKAAGSPPGSPSGGEMKRAAAALLKGMPVPSLGELDLAERNVMQVRTVGVPRIVSGAVSICLIIVAIRYGIGGLASLFILPAAITSGNAGELADVVANVLILVGIVLGLGILFNVRNLAYRVPGFSSPVPRTRNLTWGGYAAVMVVLVVVLQGVLPGAGSAGAGQQPGQYAHVTASALDDGSETFVQTGGDLTVNLSGWPSTEWAGVQFKTSNPSVLSLDAGPAAGAAPIAKFGAHQQGVSRVDAMSADGRYTFQLRVDVGQPAAP